MNGCIALLREDAVDGTASPKTTQLGTAIIRYYIYPNRLTKTGMVPMNFKYIIEYMLSRERVRLSFNVKAAES